MKIKCLLTAVMAICVFCGACKSKQPIGQPAGNTENAEAKTAKENIVKALIDIQSATKIGVNKNNFIELLTTATSVYNFEKLKLKDERCKNFIQNSEKALYYYAKVADGWESHLKYESSVKDGKFTLISSGDLREFSKYGLTDIRKIQYSEMYPDRDSNHYENSYYIRFDEFLSLYWQITDKYIEKLKTEI